jgi:hypothetical protein
MSVNIIETFDSPFPKKDVITILDDMMSPGWQFGHGSNRGKLVFPFWIKKLNDNPFYADYLLNIIKEKTQQDYELSDVYANGHTFGTMGDFHVDWYDSSGRTFLYYPNTSWKPEWGGKTIFKMKDGEYYHPYNPDSAILFPGEIPHMAEGVSRLFVGLRVTIAWKLILK